MIKRPVRYDAKNHHIFEADGHSLCWLTRNTHHPDWANKDAAGEEIAAALNDDGWTYCDDRWPEKEGLYLVTLNDGTVTCQWIYHRENYGSFMPSNVIAWRPTPEPAKGRDV